MGATTDLLGAFCRDNDVAVPARRDGPLSGLTFAIKDVFDVEGSRTGFGHPDWLAGQPPASLTAPAVTDLLDAGASLAGRTISDELCYSLSGVNVHYGTPLNPRAPDRVPGGSSSGSASAVAGGLVDLGLGTDCGGSIRVPASYCGVFGVRPTHGRVSLAGVPPFAPSFDTVGWLARDPGVLLRAGRVLLHDDRPVKPFRRLVIAADAFGHAEGAVREALSDGVAAIAAEVGTVADAVVSEDGLEAWFETFRVIQAAEIWTSLGDWIGRSSPRFGPGVRERFVAAASVSPGEVRAADRRRDAIIGALDDLIGSGDVLCLPTTPRTAPLRTEASDDLEVRYRHRAMALLCIAGLGGLPQVSLPLGEADGVPVGLSLVARRGADVDLLGLAHAVCGVVPPSEVRSGEPQRYHP